MPTALTDASSFDTMNGPVGADIRNAAGVRTLLQAAANRTRFLFDRLNPLDDVAALAAIVSPADKLVRHVRELGVYMFDIGSADPEALPYIVAPSAGAGMWYLSFDPVPLGLATLGPDGKIALAQRYGGVVSIQDFGSSGSLGSNVLATALTAYQDVCSVTFTGIVNIGDLVHISAYALLQTAGTSTLIQARILVTDDGTDVSLTPTEVRMEGTPFSYAPTAKYVAAPAGDGSNLTVKVQVKSSGGTPPTVNVKERVSLVATLIRP